MPHNQGLNLTAGSVTALTRVKVFFRRSRLAQSLCVNQEQMNSKGTLIFFCGKMGAGKSRKSIQFSQDRNAVLLSEDEWLASLYPGQISSFDDYIKFSALLRPLVKVLAQGILSAGANVIMDFPANTVKQRTWFNTLATEVGATHELVFLKVTDEQCLKNIAKRRNEKPARAAFDTEEFFHHVTSFFEEPSADEGLNIKIIKEHA